MAADRGIGMRSSRRSGIRWGAIGLGALVALVLVYLAASELRSSAWQARWLARVAGEMRYDVQPGPSAAIRFPREGPFDERLGYTRIPGFVERLSMRGHAVAAQARQSQPLADFIASGYFAPYPEKTQAGLRVLDCRGDALYGARHPQLVYASFDAIPPLLARTLAFIENRDLLADGEATRNPALELPRLGRAVLDQAIKLIDDDHPGAGGSTLATQIEKYRHSPDGRTPAIVDKWRQVASASVRVYSDGEDTSAARARILLDYVNTVPLGALRGWGEVNGLGDGLAAWYGADFDAANRVLREPATKPAALRAQARVYRQVLSLMIAQRRPTFYFGAGQGQLAKLTDRHLRRLAVEGVIDARLRDAALDAWMPVRELHVGGARNDGVDLKAAQSARVQLSALLDLPNPYELDRLDLAAASTLDARLQAAVTETLHRLRNPQAAKAAGLTAFQLLDRGDPSQLVYSFTLIERGNDGVNRVRVQTDNNERPFDINTGAKLELGSTAKLRTLVTYLETITALHDELAPQAPDARARLAAERGDRLTRWAVEHLAQAGNGHLDTMLAAAMERRYSAHPGETFITGGGAHTFENFDRESDGRKPSLSEAFRDSVNLVFIRLMRDLVQHRIARAPGAAGVLDDDAHPLRAALLARFADREGSQFLRTFYRKYQGKTPDEVQDLFLSSVRPIAQRLAAVHRLLEPHATLDAFSAFVNGRLPRPAAPAQLSALYKSHAVERLTLPDRGYLAGVHPLELWLVGHLRAHPQATLQHVLDASGAERQAAYGWLLRKKDKHARDVRIRALLEVDAFAEIHASWQRLGYPFDSLVPSYATAIGSSGDRPAALAELMGIILNGGVRQPTVLIEGLHFAAGTPYETLVRRRPGSTERVLAPEVAKVLKRALALVVEQGTARRLRGAFDAAGAVAVGGKTGTGDNRFNRYTRAGVLIDSRVINRTATFVFYLGERHFGTMTAYVPGAQAEGYRFTSGLPVQIVKTMAPLLAPLASPRQRATCAPAADLRRAPPSLAWPEPAMPAMVENTLRGVLVPLSTARP
jgi:membrane peptidoglycan carboxypeptidase